MKKYIVIGLIFVLFFSLLFVYKDSFIKKEEEKINMYIFREGISKDFLNLKEDFLNKNYFFNINSFY